VEEKLRQRGLDPATVLKDFREVDTQRRQAITEAETLKARRNRASEDNWQAEKERPGCERRSWPRPKTCASKSRQGRKLLPTSMFRLGRNSLRNSQHSHASVPVGTSAEQNVEVRRWGRTPQFRLHCEAALGN